jgi:hypothetical protein
MDYLGLLWMAMDYASGGTTGIRTRKKHPEKALTAVQIRALKKPGRYADGNGLYLKVTVSGAKRWELPTVVRGKRCDMGLGGLKLGARGGAEVPSDGPQ